MFGIDSSELFIVALVALLVIGPSRLPMAMRTVGQWVAKGRAVTRHVRTGFDAMVREAELEELQKAWAKQNEAIMKATALDPGAMLQPDPAQTAAEAMEALPAPEVPVVDPTAAEPPVAEPPVAETADVATPKPRKPRKRAQKTSVDDA